jgi:hypothetical protein
MNCGHAVTCSQCKTLVNDVCLICGSKINYYINAVPKKEKNPEEFSRHLSSINEEDYVKQSNLLEIDSCDKSFDKESDNKEDLSSKRRRSEKLNSDGGNKMIELSKKSQNFSKPALQKNSEKLLSEKNRWKTSWAENEEEMKIVRKPGAKSVEKSGSNDSSMSDHRRDTRQPSNRSNMPVSITHGKPEGQKAKKNLEADEQSIDSADEESGSKYGSQSFNGKEMTEKGLVTDEDLEMDSDRHKEDQSEDSAQELEIKEEGLKKGAQYRSRGYLNPTASQRDGPMLNKRSEF